VKKNIQTENDFDNANTQLQDVQAKYEKSEKQIAEVGFPVWWLIVWHIIP
jgi:hypothetical protein